MATLSGITGSTLFTGVADSSANASRRTTEQPSAAARQPLNAKQAAEAIDKASANAAEAFTALVGLREELAAAAKPGAELDKDGLKALGDRLADVLARIDTLAAGAKAGDVNLLGDKRGLSLTTAAGDRLDVAGHPLDTAALNLAGLSVTDADSLRKAAGRVALAAGGVQSAVFGLRAAAGVVGPAPANAGLEAYEKIFAARAAAQAPAPAAAGTGILKLFT